MSIFMVERYVPGATTEGLRQAVARATSAVAALGREGTTVRYLSCTFVPSEGSVFCFFEGPSRATVEDVNQRAGFEFDQVVEVTEIMRAGSPAVASSAG